MTSDMGLKNIIVTDITRHLMNMVTKDIQVSTKFWVRWIGIGHIKNQCIGICITYELCIYISSQVHKIDKYLCCFYSSHQRGYSKLRNQ